MAIVTNHETDITDLAHVIEIPPAVQGETFIHTTSAGPIYHGRMRNDAAQGGVVKISDSAIVVPSEKTSFSAIAVAVSADGSHLISVLTETALGLEPSRPVIVIVWVVIKQGDKLVCMKSFESEADVILCNSCADGAAISNDGKHIVLPIVGDFFNHGAISVDDLGRIHAPQLITIQCLGACATWFTYDESEIRHLLFSDRQGTILVYNNDFRTILHCYNEHMAYYPFIDCPGNTYRLAEQYFKSHPIDNDGWVQLRSIQDSRLVNEGEAMDYAISQGDERQLLAELLPGPVLRVVFVETGAVLAEVSIANARRSDGSCLPKPYWKFVGFSRDDTQLVLFDVGPESITVLSWDFYETSRPATRPLPFSKGDPGSEQRGIMAGSARLADSWYVFSVRGMELVLNGLRTGEDDDENTSGRDSPMRFDGNSAYEITRLLYKTSVSGDLQAIDAQECRVQILSNIEQFPFLLKLGILGDDFQLPYVSRPLVESKADDPIYRPWTSAERIFIKDLVRRSMYLSQVLPSSSMVERHVTNFMDCLSEEENVLMPYVERSLITSPTYLQFLSVCFARICEQAPATAVTILRAASYTPTPYKVGVVPGRFKPYSYPRDCRSGQIQYVNSPEFATFAHGVFVVDRTYLSWRCTRYLAQFLLYWISLWSRFLPQRQSTSFRQSVLCVTSIPDFCKYGISISRNDENCQPQQSFFGTKWPVPESAFSATVELMRDNDEIFGLPFMEVLILFKWRTFARHRWITARLVPLIAIYIIFLIAITLPGGSDSKVASGLMVLVLLYNIVRLAQESWQLVHSGRRYIASLYNLFDLVVLGFTTATAVLVIRSIPSTPKEGWVVTVTILLVWFHTLLQLRVFRPVRMYIYATVALLKHVVAFLTILGAVVFASSNALYMYLRPKIPSAGNIFNGTLSDGMAFAMTEPVDDTIMFARFHQSLKAVYMFLTGDYPSTASWGGDPMIDTLKIAFFILTTLVMFNTFIAIVSDLSNRNTEENRRRWIRELAEMVVGIERTLLWPSERENPAYFPRFVYYEADPNKVEVWRNRDAEWLPEAKSAEIYELRELVTKMEKTHRKHLDDIGAKLDKLAKPKGNRDPGNCDGRKRTVPSSSSA